MSAKAAFERAASPVRSVRDQWHAYVSMGIDAQGKRVGRHVRGRTPRGAD